MKGACENRKSGVDTMKIAFSTIGCKVNLYETEALKSLFSARSHEIVADDEQADAYIVNTCAVTSTSAKKSRQAVRRALRKNPDAVVAVIGCYSQLEKDIFETIPGVDIVMGTTNRARLVDHVEEIAKERGPIIDIEDVTRYKTFDKLGVTAFTERTRAFLKIQDGCDNFCSFCIIPFARGRIRSRAEEEIIAEAERLVDQGYKEIVLTGIHTGAYGYEREDVSLARLVERLVKLPALERVRISSLEINEIDEHLLTLLAEEEKLAPHLHIPLQHGDDSVLRRMRRHYDIETFKETIAQVRRALPSLAVTTDVIAGFPGETEAEFETMCATIEEIGFAELHVFPFSPRPNTAAAGFDKQVSPEVKKERVNKLLKLNEDLAKAYREDLLQSERTMRLLVESCDSTGCSGHTGEYVRVRIDREEAQANTVRTVRLRDAAYPVSTGEVVG